MLNYFFTSPSSTFSLGLKILLLSQPTELIGLIYLHHRCKSFLQVLIRVATTVPFISLPPLYNQTKIYYKFISTLSNLAIIFYLVLFNCFRSNHCRIGYKVKICYYLNSLFALFDAYHYALLDI